MFCLVFQSVLKESGWLAGLKAINQSINQSLCTPCPTAYTWTRELDQGTKYYVTLQACNRAGLCRVTSSSSMTFDDSPPTSGHVTVGFYGHHTKFLGHK